MLPVASDAQNPDAFPERVLEGWEHAQRASDFSPNTIRTRRAVVVKLVDFSGHCPWEWSIGDGDEFFAHARGVKNLSHSTVRAYQGAIKLFCDYACNPRYDWSVTCAELFGTVFIQVITELNRVTHSQPTETRPAKRPFTQSELQQLFDLADLEVDTILNSGRHGALSAWRDSVA